MMMWFQDVWEIAKTDLKQKYRRKSTQVTVIIFVFITNFCLPDKNAKFIFSTSIENDFIESARGYYNSDWISIMIVGFFSIILFFCGIYLVRTSLRMELNDGYGMLMATSPVRKTSFFEGKRLSNFLYLASLMLVIEFFGILIQLIRAENLHINLLTYLSVYIIIILPFVYLIATIALLFEAVPFLRGSFGNVIIFFLGMMGLILCLNTSEVNHNIGILGNLSDIRGLNFSMLQVEEAFNSQLGTPGDTLNYGWLSTSPPYTDFFKFQLRWNALFILSRIDLVIVGFIFLYIMQAFTPLNSLFIQPSKDKKQKKESNKIKKEKKDQNLLIPELNVTEQLSIKVKNSSIWRLFYYQVLTVIREKKLVSMILIILAILQWLPFGKDVSDFVFFAVTLVPLFLWSQIGLKKEEDFLKVTVAYPKRLMQSRLIGNYVGWTLYFSGTLFYSLVYGNFVGFITILISVIFVVSIVYTINQLTHSELLFEGIYILVWYIDIVQDVKLLNLFNSSSQSILSIVAMVIISMVSVYSMKLK